MWLNCLKQIPILYTHRDSPSLVPSPIPGFSMLHAEKREGLVCDVTCVSFMNSGAKGGEGWRRVAKGDYRAWVWRLVRHAHFYCILIAHHREHTEGKETQDRQGEQCGDGLRCRNYRSEVILQEFLAIGGHFCSTCHRQVEG